MTRFGAAVAKVDEREPGIDLPLLSVSQTRGVIRRTELTSRPARAESLDAYKICRRGDIVFNKMSIRAGAMGVAREDGLVTYHYEVMRPVGGADPRFIVYLMKSSWFTKELILRERGIGAGDQTNVRTTEVPFRVMRSIDCPIPLVDEQRAIADYLDRETAQIDTLIAEQERLVGLLRERRIAIISALATRGTVHDVPMRSSGADWIGDIPSHWEVRPLKYSVESVQTGVWGSDPQGDEDDVLCVRVADFERPRLRVGATVETIRSVPEKDRAHRLLQPGDLLLEKSGGTNLNPVGFVGIYEGRDEQAVCANFLTRLRPSGEQAPRYWLYAHAASYSTRLTARSVKKTTGIQNLDQDSYLSELFPYPPLDEQEVIAKEIDAQTARLDILMDESERFIELARERRSALITAAVTGQIDIPEAS